MKKTIYSLIIASFVFGLIATAVKAEDTNSEMATTTAVEAVTTSYPATVTTTAAPTAVTTSATPTDLEKIPSPEYIKYFQMIKKIGNSLFGVRKATTTDRVEPKKPEDMKKPEISATSSKLEKIEHPGLVNLYEKIQKIGTALWGIKKKATSTPFIIAPEVSACVVAAIDVKDKALMARVTVAATELNSALSARSACQQAAVVATSSPRETLNACVKTFNEANKAIREASKKLQNDTWKAYQESLKACRTSATSTSPVPMIEDGGNLFN